MSTDWIAAAAEEIAMHPSPGNQFQATVEDIIRRHYAALPPDPQDAALTAERERLLRRSVKVCHDVMRFSLYPPADLDEYQRQCKSVADGTLSVVTDAARLGITGDAK